MLLFLNTTQSNNQILIAKNNQIIDYQDFPASRNDLENILPKIDKILTKNNLDKFNIKEIFVVIGPGSFIGIRIWLTMVNTLLSFIPNSKGYSILQTDLEKFYQDKKPAQNILNLCQKIIKEQQGEKKLFPFYGKNPNITFKKSE